MTFQYTYDAKGKPVGVFVPMNEWEIITSQLKKKKSAKKQVTGKDKIISGIEKGMKQVSLIEKGKLESISLQQLMDAL